MTGKMEREESEEITKKLKEGDEIFVFWYLPTHELNSHRGIFSSVNNFIS